MHKHTFPGRCFPHPLSRKLFRTVSHIAVRQERRSCPKEPLVLEFCAKISATGIVGDVSAGLRHSDLGSFSSDGASYFLTWREPASLACKAHPGSLAITSRTFAVVICDADEPRFVNTGQDLESPCTTSPRSTTRPLYFRNFCSNSEFLKCRESSNVANVNSPSPFLCLVNDLALALDFSSLAMLAKVRAFPTLCHLRLSHPQSSLLGV